MILTRGCLVCLSCVIATTALAQTTRPSTTAPSAPGMNDGVQVLRVYVETPALSAKAPAAIRPLALAPSPRTCVDIALTRNDVTFVGIDQKASQLSVFNDDVGTKLIETGSIRLPGCLDDICEGGHTCRLRIQSSKSPGKGACELSIRGTVVVFCGKEERETVLKAVRIGSTVNLTAGPARATLSFDQEDCILTVAARLDAIKTLSYITAQGDEIKTTLTCMSSTADHKPTRTYHPSQPIKGKLDVHITYWNVVEPLKIDVDLNTGVGWGAAMQPATQAMDQRQAIVNRQNGLNVLWLMVQDPLMARLIPRSDSEFNQVFFPIDNGGPCTRPSAPMLMGARISDTGKIFLGLDARASNLKYVRDDKDDDLLSQDPSAGPAIHELSISNDRHECFFTIGAENLPAAGSRHVRLKGTVVMLYGDSLKQATVEFLKGGITAGPLDITWSRERGGLLELEFASAKPMDAIADVRIQTYWDKKDIKEALTISEVICRLDKIWEDRDSKDARYKRRYVLPYGWSRDYATVIVHYTDKVETVSIPVEATSGLGS